MFIDEDHLGQVKFGQLFKVTVLNLHVIMIKPEIKLIIQQLDSIGANITITNGAAWSIEF